MVGSLLTRDEDLFRTLWKHKKKCSDFNKQMAAGGGKSWSLLADALKYIDCPEFYAVFFRKTIKQLKRTLWKEAKKMYYPLLIDDKGKFIGKAVIKEQDMIIRFPTGATLEFSYLDRDADAEMNWQGAEISAAYFDEFTHFSEYCFNYIRTRMRSDSKYESFIRCGLNPHPTHFVHKYLNPFIKDDGFVIKEYSGKPAYFVVDKGQIITSWSIEELGERYPDKTPIKYTMIPSFLENNKHMLSKNKSYKEVLEANDPANAAQLLSGNWRYTPAANGIFDRSTVTPSQIVTEEPDGCVYYRCWDKAAQVPATEGGDSKTLDPDYTASILFGVKDGNVYVMGDYIRDEKTQEQLARFRQKVGKRDETILQQALYDIEMFGDKVFQVLPQDPGQSGIAEREQAAKALQKHGVKVLKDACHGNKSKSIRFEPFCVACHNSSVFWVKTTFDLSVWDYMLLELENFNPLIKNNGFHDDLVDSFSSAWHISVKSKPTRAYTLPDTSNGATLLSKQKL